MGYWKELAAFCWSEGLDPHNAYSQRAFELAIKGLPWAHPEVPKIVGDEPLSWQQIDELIDGVSGTVNVPCPYCSVGKEYSTRMRITRTAKGLWLFPPGNN
jgi:hypothetical protein